MSFYSSNLEKYKRSMYRAINEDTINGSLLTVKTEKADSLDDYCKDDTTMSEDFIEAERMDSIFKDTTDETREFKKTCNLKSEGPSVYVGYATEPEKKCPKCDDSKSASQKEVENYYVGAVDTGVNDIWSNKGYDNDYSSIYRSKEFNEAVSTVLDLQDARTRKYILSLNEADQAQVLSSLTSKLYAIVVKRIDDIDYGEIPNSKGDITKIPNWNETLECIDLVSQIVKEYKQKTDQIDEINKAIGNMIKRTPEFTKAYKNNVELPMVMYCNMTLAIIASTSYMVSSCIEFIKSPGNDGFEMALDKVAYSKSKNAMLFNNLKNFNKACVNGDMDKSLDLVLNPSNRKRLQEGAIIPAGAAGIIALVAAVICTIIPLLRSIVYYFYHIRTNIADYFEIQADLLQMNAINLKNSNREVKNKDKVVEKQLNIVKKFRKLSNFFAIENRKAEVNASKDISDEEKEKKKAPETTDDSEDDNPNSILF